jgi:competence protein ComEC
MHVRTMFVFACALLGGGMYAVHPMFALAAFLCALCILFAQKRKWVALCVVILSSAGALRALNRVDAYASRRATWRTLAPGLTLCHGDGTIAHSPTVVGTSVRVIVHSANFECEGNPMPAGELLLYGQGDSSVTHGVVQYRTGDRVEFTAQLGVLERFANSAESRVTVAETQRNLLGSGGALDIAVVEHRQSLASYIDVARNFVRARINATMAPDAAPMARAMMLGETDLDADDLLAFHQSGLSHLLAVSGMHLVLVVGTLVKLLRAALLRWSWLAARTDVRRLAAGAGIPAVWAYAYFAGASGSAMRAAVMLTCMWVATACKLRAAAGRALLVSTVLLAVWDPLAVLDLSLLLSLAATFGLIWLSPLMQGAFAWVLAQRMVSLQKSLASTVAATIPCLPLLASMGSRVSLGSAYLNLLAVPLGEVCALPLCMLHALSFACPPLEKLLAAAASGALIAVRFLARAGATVTFVTLPPPTALQWSILAVLCFWVGSAVLSNRRKLQVVALGAMCWCSAELYARHRGAPHGKLRVTFIDVGQGDAALVDLPNGDAMLIDGGGFVGSPVDTGKRAILPLLAMRRRAKLNIVALSHPHPDHAGGLASVLRQLPTSDVWDSGQGRQERATGAYAAFRDAATQTKTRIIEAPQLCGIHAIGGAIVEVLAPCPLVEGRGANDGSLVIRIRYGKRAVLFVGDAEAAEENELLKWRSSQLAADVLKVGHHGSKTSTSSAFLQAVSPAHAVISSGVRNRFHHPHPRTLQTLEQASLSLWRTDQRGAIVMETDGDSLSVTPLAP